MPKMSHNPLHNKSQSSEIVKAYPLDFYVYCISNGEDEEIESCVKVKEFCDSRGIVFRIRDFDSKKYDDDATMITTLPSYYLCKHRTTIPYTVLKPDETIESVKGECLRCKEFDEEKKRKAKEKAETWNRMYTWLKQMTSKKSVIMVKQ